MGTRRQVAFQCKDLARPVDQGEMLKFRAVLNDLHDEVFEVFVARVDQRSLSRDQVDLSHHGRSNRVAAPPRRQPRVTIETSGSPGLTVGSHALLLQLAANLVQNAIVHNLPKGGAVWVSTGAHPEGVELTVENTGGALTPDLVSTLTEPFLRGTEPIYTDHAGVGLGLAIVKSITEAHDGTLTLTARADGGLSVTARLPCAY